METVRQSRPDDGDRMLAIWRDAVDATHTFLRREDRAALDKMLSGFLPYAQAWVVVDGDDLPVAFMLLTNGHMDALFVDPAAHGSGIGRALVQHGLALTTSMTTDVNEQNEPAIAFYERLGFRKIGRSPCDGQGRPYPLLHMVFP